MGKKPAATASVNADPISSALTQRDCELQKLRESVQIHTLRTSQYKTRLLATLDTLDATQLSHKRELESLHNTITLLTEKVSRYAYLLRQAESERDEMKEGFTILVEKVEQSKKDFRGWPYSRMQMSNTVEPMRPRRHDAGCDHGSLLSFAASMLSSVRMSLSREEREHAYTRQRAETKVASLEAQLSRREAEVEECIAQAGRPTEAGVPSRRKRNVELSDNEHDSVRAQAVKENRVLEKEVLRLEQKLRDAMVPSSPEPTHTPPPFPSPSATPRAGTSTSLPPFTASSTPRAVGAGLPSIDQQIEELGRQVSAFKNERDHLLAMVEGNKHRPMDINVAQPAPPLHPIHVDATTQTTPPPNPIALSPPSSSHLTEDEDDTIRPPDTQLLDMDDDEVSMELATPLMPSILTLQSLDLSPHSGSEGVPSMMEDNGSDSYVDPPSVPLPPSPPSQPP